MTGSPSPTVSNSHQPTTQGPLRQHPIKRIARRVMGWLGLNLRYQLTPGVSVFGINLFIDSRKGPPAPGSTYALEYVKNLAGTSVLDVGSGGGQHAKALQMTGRRVTCVDYGTSVYATNSTVDGLHIVYTDFNKFSPTEKYDLVWASHILEHQRNAGAFIEKLVECCATDGYVCITAPDLHRNLWGGHLSLWTPGLLAYNIVLCGIDASSAKFIRGTNEFSIVFRPKKAELPSNLTFDSGDLAKIAAYLPPGIGENSDPWDVQYE